MKVIVGSRALWPTPEVASAVLAIMASVDDSFAIRCNRKGEIASGTEELAQKIGEILPRQVTRISAITRTSFDRDNDMVRNSTGVYAFFAPGELMHGGTGHVVAVALRMGRPVEAYELDEQGMVVQAASDAGDLLDLYPYETKEDA